MIPFTHRWRCDYSLFWWIDVMIELKGLCFCSYSTSKPSTIRRGLTGTMSPLTWRPLLYCGPSRCPYLLLAASVERCQSLTSSECWEGKATPSVCLIKKTDFQESEEFNDFFVFFSWRVSCKLQMFNITHIFPIDYQIKESCLVDLTTSLSLQIMST